jgi:hypothetical protein
MTCAPFGRALLLLVGLVLLPQLAGGCGSSKNTPVADASSKPDAGDAAIPTSAKAAIGAKVFDESQVQSYYLTFSDEEYARLPDLQTLLLDPYTVNADRYVRATLRVGDTELPIIGVRYKGNYSIWGCVDFATGQRVKRVEPIFGNVDVCQRFSLKLDFNRDDDTLRLDGLKKLNRPKQAARAPSLLVVSRLGSVGFAGCARAWA